MLSDPLGPSFDPLEFARVSREFTTRFKDPDVRLKFGRNLKALLYARCMEIAQLGNAAGVDGGLISRLMGHQPKVQTKIPRTRAIKYIGAFSIANVLGVSLESMLTKDFRAAIDTAIEKLNRSSK